jgi:MFS family permease
MNVWATVSNLGAAVGLIVGGVLTTYASWRWTLFINVPVGALVGVAAPFVLADSPRRLGRLDLAGAATVTGGVATLTYALSSAAPSSASDHAHWGDADVIAACVAGLALVGAFALVESRIRNPCCRRDSSPIATVPPSPCST